jgi:hypothetical protein
MQRYGKTWTQRLRELLVHSEFSEPHNQQQNPVELRAVRWLKEASKVIRKRTGAPKSVWLQAAQYLADIHNMTSDETLDWKTPRSARQGTQTDISQLVQFQFWEPIVYLDTEEKFPSTKEKPGRWVGIAHNVGDLFCWKIFDEEKEIIIERSVINSRRTKQHLAVEQELQEMYGLDPRNDKDSSDSDLSLTSQKQKIESDPTRKARLKERRQRRKQARTNKTFPDSQTTQLDKDIDQALRTVINDGNPPLANSIVAQDAVVNDTGLEETQPIVDQDDTSELLTRTPPKTTTVPSNTPIMATPPIVVRRSQRNINRPTRFNAMMKSTASIILAPLVAAHSHIVSTHDHMIPAIEHNPVQDVWDYDDGDFRHRMNNVTSRQRREYVRLCDDQFDTENDPIDHRIWQPLRMSAHSILKRKNKQRRVLARVSWLTEDDSWISLDALREDNPFLIIDYVITKPMLLKSKDFNWVMHYIHDAPQLQRMSNAFKAVTSGRQPKIKFGTEVPYSIHHALQLDQRNGNSLWREAIDKEPGQLNEYKTFRRRNSGEDLHEYTRIPYHCVFDVNFDGRRKRRLVAGGGDHTTPSKESVFSGVVNISSVRLGFLIAELNDLQVCAADIGNAFLYGHTREKVFIKAGRDTFVRK